MPAHLGEIEQTFREQYGRAVAVLIRVFGDIDLAEEAVQDAFAVAVQRWPSTGVPPSPAGWIITTARNRAIDRIRREASRDDRHAEARRIQAGDEEPPEEVAVRDDRLRLIFTCCHPSLTMSAQVALTLRLLGGLTTAETQSYVQHHLALAGRSDTLFSDDAVALIHEVSRGLPRQVNNLAVSALIAAFAAKKAIVDESAARAAVAEIAAE